MKKCPFCAKEIQDDTIVCQHCGRDLTEKSQIAQAAVVVLDKLNDEREKMNREYEKARNYIHFSILVLMLSLVLEILEHWVSGTCSLILGILILLIHIYKLTDLKGRLEEIDKKINILNKMV